MYSSEGTTNSISVAVNGTALDNRRILEDAEVENLLLQLAAAAHTVIPKRIRRGVFIPRQGEYHHGKAGRTASGKPDTASAVRHISPAAVPL